jgi:hypothetical protein
MFSYLATYLLNTKTIELIFCSYNGDQEADMSFYSEKWTENNLLVTIFISNFSCPTSIIISCPYT